MRPRRRGHGHRRAARRAPRGRNHEPQNHLHEFGAGHTSNLATSILVILATKFGLPVSMTHVSVGSLFGIGLLTGQAKTKTVSGIVLSWVITLPCAALIGGVAYLIIHRFQ